MLDFGQLAILGFNLSSWYRVSLSAQASPVKKNLNNEREKAEKKERQRLFIACLRGTDDVPPMSIRASCDFVGVVRSTVKMWQNTDVEFAAAFDSAIEDSGDALEDVAVHRAVKGQVKDVYYLGEVVGEQREYDNQLLMNILRGRGRMRPDGPVVNVTVNTASEMPTDQLMARALALVLAEAKMVEGKVS